MQYADWFQTSVAEAVAELAAPSLAELAGARPAKPRPAGKRGAKPAAAKPRPAKRLAAAGGGDLAKRTAAAADATAAPAEAALTATAPVLAAEPSPPVLSPELNATAEPAADGCVDTIANSIYMDQPI